MAVCSTTGLAYINGPVTGYRIAKSSYGPLSPLPRAAGPADRSSWSRFDTPGSTVYLAGDRRTAYAETLAVARVGKEFRDAVVFAAHQFGVPVEEARRLIQDDWTRNGNMVPGWLPANWRDGRLIYTLRINTPTRWIDLTTAESIASLNRHLGQQLDEAYGIPAITLATLTGEDREATTAIAEWLREQVLDDGNYAAGVRAHSKYGGGMCWAYWLRRQDDRLGPDPVELQAEAEIHRDDPDLNYVLGLYGLDCR
ncbi:hypothetical protein QF036_005113 [Arthrobacter globiformis]|nr:RES domain-containing protein [Arthrobacter globiformis]MDQ0867462.1 hypothetical protein [Arthrobacter globiformis]